LESEGFAKSIDRERVKKPMFEVAGFGSACDAHHLTAPHPEGRGLEAAIRSAMKQAGIEPGEIGFINAHGTATQDNDRAEGKVIARVFGGGTPFYSTKGFTGHTLGAAGGLEGAFAVLGLREGWIPASIGFENAAEDTFVSPVQRLTKIAGRYALSTSLAFGGNNAAVIIRRVE
jgi:3-oxoacyl-(acyl-carrier-protein) synthase